MEVFITGVCDLHAYLSVCIKLIIALCLLFRLLWPLWSWTTHLSALRSPLLSWSWGTKEHFCVIYICAEVTLLVCYCRCWAICKHSWIEWRKNLTNYWVSPERSIWRVNHLLRINVVQVSLHHLFTTCLWNQFTTPVYHMSPEPVSPFMATMICLGVQVSIIWLLLWIMVSLMISLLVVSAGTRSASVLGGLQPRDSSTYFLVCNFIWFWHTCYVISVSVSPAPSLQGLACAISSTSR